MIKLNFNEKKHIGTGSPGISSVWMKFEYADLSKIKQLPEVFKISLWDFECNAILNTDAKIAIETKKGRHTYPIDRLQHIEEDMNHVDESMIRVDIYIEDQVSWLIRCTEINIKESIDV